VLPAPIIHLPLDNRAMFEVDFVLGVLKQIVLICIKAEKLISQVNTIGRTGGRARVEGERIPK